MEHVGVIDRDGIAKIGREPVVEERMVERVERIGRIGPPAGPDAPGIGACGFQIGAAYLRFAKQRSGKAPECRLLEEQL
ncbi:hypothetical protein D3C71_2051040 [compost metagenome]